MADLNQEATLKVKIEADHPALKTGASTTEWASHKLVTGIAALVMVAGFIENHEMAAEAAGKVIPGLGAYLPQIMAISGFIVIFASHIHYVNGRVDFKATFMDLAEVILKSGAGRGDKTPGGFEKAVAADLSKEGKVSEPPPLPDSPVDVPDLVKSFPNVGSEKLAEIKKILDTGIKLPESGKALAAVVALVFTALIVVTAVAALVCGCGSIPKAHLDSDQAFLDSIGTEYAGFLWDAHRLPDGRTLTAEVRQDRLDALSAKRREVARAMKSMGYPPPPTSTAAIINADGKGD